MYLDLRLILSWLCHLCCPLFFADTHKLLLSLKYPGPLLNMFESIDNGTML